MPKFIRYSIYSLTMLLALITASCQDDFNYSTQEKVEEGLPVTIGLRINLPAMSVQSRADLSEADANRVRSLWVGIFNKKTGDLTGYNTVENINHTDKHTVHSIKIDTKTGESRIVAVANLDSHAIKKGGQKTTLSQLLADVKTWDDFLSIAYCLPASGTVDTPTEELPMAGFYSTDGLDATHSSTWGETMSDETYTIAATGNGAAEIRKDGSTVNGYIHLRRLISQIKFEISSTNDNLTIEPYSWQVKNVPEISWVHERTTNATDDEGFTIYNNIEGYFADSDTYSTEDFSNHNGTFSFDYWQLENKRTGTGVPNYADREKEEKNGDGLNSEKPKYTYLNGKNNYATYVTIKCRLTYKNKLQPGDQDYEYVDEESERTADATYVIHLGGINDDFNDFNSRRNTIYTYKVSISGVNQIVVEANEEGNEERPGAEGIVTDITNSNVTIDCHYSMVNMQFSDYELTHNGTELGMMGFLIHAYDAKNQLITIDEKSFDANGKFTGDENYRKYVEWIEIRPTTAENVYASYKPHEGDHADYLTKYLYELNSFVKEGNENDHTQKWYTVFFKEYAYESGNTSYNWKDYVNKPNRSVWFKTIQAESTDKESVHLKAKYAVQQRSIQTYYNTTLDKVKEAIGVEHLNETFGARLRYTSATSYSDTNGKNSVINYLGLNKNTTPAWSQYVTNEVYSVPQITNQGGYPGLEVYVAKTAVLSSQLDITNDPKYSDASSYDSYYVEVLNACMNRNRDLDGDGNISAEEVRWYVPSSSQYQRIILGRRSLTSPIMQDFDNITLYNSSKQPDNINNQNTRYHYAASDNKKIWTEEGLSVSNILDTGNNSWELGAWQVRCIRNLGLDESATTDISIEKAYNNVGNIFHMDKYDSRNVRDYAIDHTPSHNIYNQQYNRIYKAFEMSNQDIDVTSLINFKGDYSIDNNYSKNWTNYLSNESNDPCKSLNDKLGAGERSWRVPNQKELTMMYANGKLTNGLNYISATHEFFDYQGQGYVVNNTVESHYNRRYLGINHLYPYAINFKDSSNTFYVRCVRDKEVEVEP